MKRLLLTLAGLLTVFSLAACSQTKTSDPTFIEPLEDLGDMELSDVMFDSNESMIPQLMGPPSSGDAMGHLHTVRRGDTLWSIATRMYGNGQRWREIQHANLGVEPRKLRVGQELVVP